MLTRISVWNYLGFVIYLSLYFIVCQSIWYYPAESIKSAIFKVLPILHLIFVIYYNRLPDQDEESRYYGRHVICGLVCSAIGDVMLVWRYRLFVPGLVAFGVAHLFYIRAFGVRPLGGGPTLTSFLLLSAGSLAVVVGGVSEGPVTWSLVCLYHCVISAMTWRAAVAYLTCPGSGSMCACAGALLFAGSDFLLAVDRWRRPIDGAAFYIHALYYVGQMLIATSVLCYDGRHLAKRD